jgi:hypothetical protein
MSSLLFSFGTPDFMMAGVAMLAVLCGIVLMGGRSLIGGPIRVLSSLYSRRGRREAVVVLPHIDSTQHEEVRQHSLQRAA